ncbi:MAG: hypothetical protein JWO15_3618 [Sphingomonadales bacterium]|nr:hypothetical protein [Sphingomonadales bacterium]
MITDREREAIVDAIRLLPGYFGSTICTLRNLLDRTRPTKRMRFVVHCSTERRTWTKIFYNIDDARQYAKYACYRWCAASNVKIVRQHWIS